MKKLLLILLVFIVSIETIYSQDFLGKNKVEVKAKFSEGAGNGDFIKSFGYEGYMYVSPNLRDMVIVIFNNKGICFLECLVTKDKKFIDSFIAVPLKSKIFQRTILDFNGTAMIMI